MSCTTCREMMLEALYGELGVDDRRDFDAHVSGCAECASLFEEMRATLARMSERTRPDPGDAYWNDYYDRLEARMAAGHTVVDGAPIAARRRSYVSWGYRVAAAVAVLAMGVWLGRSSITRDDHTTADPGVIASSHGADSTAKPSDEPRVATGTPEQHRALDGSPGTRTQREPGPESHVALASADVRAREYIERSQVLLLALVNAGSDTSGADPAEFATRRERAGMLVAEAAGLRDDLPGSDNRRLRELVTDLQMILREIANLESQKDLDAVKIIRNRVDREGVLLQIDVEQMRDDDQAKPAQPKRSGAID